MLKKIFLVGIMVFVIIHFILILKESYLDIQK